MGSESFCASARSSEAFLALRPPGSRIVAKTVCPLRARVSANNLPKPVLEPVMRTTCLEIMIIPPCGATVWRYRETHLMPEAMQLDTWIAIRSPLHPALALFCHPERREGSAFPFPSHRPSPPILNPSYLLPINPH